MDSLKDSTSSKGMAANNEGKTKFNSIHTTIKKTPFAAGKSR